MDFNTNPGFGQPFGQPSALSSASTSNPGIPHTPTTTMGAFTFVWIGVLNLDRAQKFYASVFDWNFLTSSRTTKKSAPTGSAPRIFMTGGEVMGALNLVAPSAEDMMASCGPGGMVPCRVPPRMLNFVKVRDIDVTLAKVVQAGGRVNREKWVEDGQGEYALMEDPEGNVLGLMKRTAFGSRG